MLFQTEIKNMTNKVPSSNVSKSSFGDTRQRRSSDSKSACGDLRSSSMCQSMNNKTWIQERFWLALELKKSLLRRSESFGMLLESFFEERILGGKENRSYSLLCGFLMKKNGKEMFWIIILNLSQQWVALRHRNFHENVCIHFCLCNKAFPCSCVVDRRLTHVLWKKCWHTDVSCI